jgi:phosphoribosyl 1,2-cyclic phosphodiesterase
MPTHPRIGRRSSRAATSRDAADASVRIWSLGSGSRGNGLVLLSGERALLVDCGFGPRALATRLKAIGVAPEQIEGLVLTHEHQDHAHGAERAQHKWRWPVYASAGTLKQLPAISARWRRPVVPGESVSAGDFALEGLDVPHDAAAPLAFAVTANASGARVGIAHDLGAVPTGLPALFARCDALLVEANHDAEMLRTGPYAASLKARIRSGRGHIDNVQAGELLASLVHPGLQVVALLHLSETNNSPSLASETVSAMLRRAGSRVPARAAAGRTPDALGTLGSSWGPAQFALAL